MLTYPAVCYSKELSHKRSHNLFINSVLQSVPSVLLSFPPSPLTLAAFFSPASVSLFFLLFQVLFSSEVWMYIFYTITWSSWDQTFCISLSVTRETGRRRDWQDKASFCNKHLSHTIWFKWIIGRNLTSQRLLSVWHFTEHYVRLSWIPVMTFFFPMCQQGTSATLFHQRQCFEWDSFKSQSSLLLVGTDW